MPINFNLTELLADDFDVFDGVELVTFTRRNPDGTTAATYASVKALRRAGTAAPAGVGQGGQAVVTYARWHLKAADMPLPPRIGDRFTTAGGETWEVLPDVRTETFGTRYSIDCKKVGG